jgi:hypothetical protein
MNLLVISPAISFSIISGMFIALVLTILVFYQGLLNMPVTNAYRIKAISILGVVLLFWAVLAIILATDGFFVTQSATKFQFSTILYIFIPVILGVIVLKYLNSFKTILNAIPVHWIIGIQFLRATGAVFLILYFQDLLPGQFALPAGIGDVLVGISAPLVAYLYYNKTRHAKKIAMVWNIAGTLDLVLALSFGFLTSPSPIQLFAIDNPNRMIGTYPLVLVPAFAVPLFLLHHIYTFRKLKLK